MGVPAFNFDNVPPVLGEGVPLTPSSGAIVPEEPTFQWNPGQDLTSGVASYELQIRIADPENDTPPITTIARVTDTGGVGNYTATRDATLSPDPMPEGKKIDWRVRTFDKAGNVRTSDWWSIRIDSTIPPAPSITDGPTGPTRDTSPTFTWAGTQQTYKWDVRRAGAETPVREGAGPDTRATLSSLPDGDYIFRVTQVTEAGRGSAEATRTFQIDTTPPDPPTILSRPTFPAITAPVFTWSAEPGAYSRWVVIGSSGTPVVGPIDTPVTTRGAPAAGRRRLQLPGAAGRRGRQRLGRHERAVHGPRPAGPRPVALDARGHDRRAGAAQAERLPPLAQARRGAADAGPGAPVDQGPARDQALQPADLPGDPGQEGGREPEGDQDLLVLPARPADARAEGQAQGGHLLRLAHLALHRPGLHPEAGGREQLLHRQLQGDPPQGEAGRAPRPRGRRPRG